MAKKFSDFAVEEKPLRGEKIKMAEVLDKKILVEGYRLTKSKFATAKGCLALQIEFEEKERVLFTGSGVLISQIQKYAHEIPFETVITQQNKYYTFN